jgi:hypothetical protein
VFTVEGSGADIWGVADEFHYVYQGMNGDGEIVARVVSVEPTDPWAKAGVMIREDLSAGSRHAMMVITAGRGAAFQRRVQAGGESVGTRGSPWITAQWVKLVRSGDTLSGYESVDGVSWQLVGTETIAMSANVYVGLVVTSHEDSQLATAVMDRVGLQ